MDTHFAHFRWKNVQNQEKYLAFLKYNVIILYHYQ